MKILHVLPSLCVGGMEMLTIQIVAAMRSLGHDAGIVTLDDEGALSATARGSGVPFQLVRSRGWRTLIAPSPLSEYLRREKPDVVHSHNGSWGRTATAAAFARVQGRAHTMHGFHEADTGKLRWIERVAVRATPLVIVVSGELKSYTVEKLFACSRQVHLVRNGIDLSHVGTPASRSSFRLEPEDVVVIAVGRLVPVKAHGNLISAFAKIAQVESRARLLIVGEGPERETLLSQIQELRLHDRILLLGERSDVRSLLRMADLFCLPSYSEGLSISLLEAMGEGLPVVATAVGATPELVTSETGVLVSPRNIDELSAGLFTLMSNRDLRERMGTAAETRVRSDFSVERTAQAYLRLYEASANSI